MPRPAMRRRRARRCARSPASPPGATPIASDAASSRSTPCRPTCRDRHQLARRRGDAGPSLRGAVVMRADGPARTSLHFTGDRISAAPAGDATNVELPGHLIFPGLVNAHDHLQVNAVPPLRAGAPFPNSYAWAAGFGAHFRDPEVVAALAV